MKKASIIQFSLVNNYLHQACPKMYTKLVTRIPPGEKGWANEKFKFLTVYISVFHFLN